jgi:hypothetical protein
LLSFFTDRDAIEIERLFGEHKFADALPLLEAAYATDTNDVMNTLRFGICLTASTSMDNVVRGSSVLFKLVEDFPQFAQGVRNVKCQVLKI